MGDIIDKLGTNKIPRLKIGIGKGRGSLVGKDYVLSTFNKEEMNLIMEEISENIPGVAIFIKEGILEAMNKMNGKKNEQ